MISPIEVMNERNEHVRAARSRVIPTAYEKFKTDHGVPMVGEKLLSGRQVAVAADGWEWSCVDPIEEGVAVPPPSDPDALRDQRAFYWKARRHRDGEEIGIVDDEIELYRSGGGFGDTLVMTASLDRLIVRREWLVKDVGLCDQMEERVEKGIPLNWAMETIALGSCWWGDEVYDPNWIFTEFKY